MTLEAIHELKTAHYVTSEYLYTVPRVHRGYAGQTLYVNLSTGHIEARPVTQQMKDIFVGRQGIRAVAAMERRARRHPLG